MRASRVRGGLRVRVKMRVLSFVGHRSIVLGENLSFGEKTSPPIKYDRVAVMWWTWLLLVA